VQTASAARPSLPSSQATIKEALERDGYAVARNFFSTEEIAWMRGEVTATLARIARRAHNGGLLCTPKRHESDLANRLLDDAQLAAHWGGELPDTVEFQADTVHDWHVDMDIEPRTRAVMLRIASGRTYTYRIMLTEMGSVLYRGVTRMATRSALLCTWAPTPGTLQSPISGFGTPAVF
jgi:hypothetical protein